MSDDKSKSFEEIFNDWYRKFLDKEKAMNMEILKAKEDRDNKLKKAREEADETIETYKKEQFEILESNKNKLRTDLNYSEKLEKEFNEQCKKMNECYTENKDNVINYLLDRIFDINLNLPASILNNKNKKY